MIRIGPEMAGTAGETCGCHLALLTQADVLHNEPEEQVEEAPEK